MGNGWNNLATKPDSGEGTAAGKRNFQGDRMQHRVVKQYKAMVENFRRRLLMLLHVLGMQPNYVQSKNAGASSSQYSAKGDPELANLLKIGILYARVPQRVPEAANA